MMTRIRTVKPDLFKHEDLYEAEMTSHLPLRMAFIALFSCCDREGRFCWRPRRLKIEMLPYDDVDMTQILDALVIHGFIKKYQCSGEWYGCITSWLRHQRVNQREPESEIPSILDAVSCERSEGCGETPVTPCGLSPVDSVAVLTPKVLVSSRVYDTSEIDEKGQALTQMGNPNASESSNDATQQIFEHWRTVMAHPSAKLDPKRRALIGKALQSGYDVNELCDAITGCSVTPHNIGDNDRGQRYDGLHVILRDSDQIDRFIHNRNHPPRAVTEAQRKTQANVHTLQQWVNQKMAEECAYANS